MALAKTRLASAKGNTIASEQQSDHLVMLAAYNGWQAALERGGARAAREYVQRNCLAFNTLQMLRDMRSQFAAMLVDIRCAATPRICRHVRGAPTRLRR